MRRIAAILALAAAVAAGTTLLPGGGAVADSTYRVDAIFDTAKGVIPGQLVKVAGARVGKIDDVTLTEDYKARVKLTLDRKFAPFRSDAHCEIQPEGLISENFVQCEPGVEGEPLRPQGEQAPTVPVENTSVPVSFTDLFEIFRTPVRERFTVVVASLGAGAAARGEEINAILRRANPTLRLTRQAIGILDEQREELTDLVATTDQVVAELAERPQNVRRFIDRAASVTTKVASRRDELAEGIRRLPALLDATDPALAELDELIVSGTPLLADLRAAAPGLDRLVGDLAPFAAAARPTLRSLGITATVGRRAITSATPVVKLLRTFASEVRPTGKLLADVLVNLRERGGVEMLAYFTYYAAAATARFDATSHFLPTRFFFNQCSAYSETPVAGCSADYNEQAQRRERDPGARRPQRAPAATPAPQAVVEPRATPKPEPPVELPDTLDDLVEELDEVLGDVLPGTGPTLPARPGGPTVPGGTPLDDLLGYLLG